MKNPLLYNLEIQKRFFFLWKSLTKIKHDSKVSSRKKWLYTNNVYTEVQGWDYS